MLQGQHHTARRATIGQRGAGPGIGRRLCQAGAALGIGAGIMHQRIAAAGTLRGPEKVQLAKTGGTEAIIAINNLAAAGAARRQHQIEGGAKRHHQRGGERTAHNESVRLLRSLRKR